MKKLRFGVILCLIIFLFVPAVSGLSHCYITSFYANPWVVTKGQPFTFYGHIRTFPDNLDEGAEILIFKGVIPVITRAPYQTLIGRTLTDDGGDFSFKYYPTNTANYRAVCKTKTPRDTGAFSHIIKVFVTNIQPRI